MSNEMLKGIFVEGYRCFRTRQEFNPLKRVNIFIGQNNVGKSTVLDLVFLGLGGVLAPQARPLFDEDDLSPDQQDAEITWGYYANYDLAVNQSNQGAKNTRRATALRKLVSALSEAQKEIGLRIGEPWVVLRSRAQGTTLHPSVYKAVIAAMSISDWNDISSTYKEFFSEGFPRYTCILRTLSSIFPVDRFELAKEKWPKIRLLHSKRHLGSGDIDPMFLQGSGMVDLLELLRDHEDPRLDEINHLIQSILDNKSIEYASIEKDGRKEAGVWDKQLQKTLPLSAIGVGVQEAVILATAIIMHRGGIICLEEPELHLHPAMQRRLLEELVSFPDTQFFITTHSAHIINAAESLTDIALFHLERDNKSTTVHTLSGSNRNNYFNVLQSLGYRASDLLQANCIIWVEGPSDRIYLNYWIQQHVANQAGRRLFEGVHYSIMYYGGSLIAHLSGEDTTLDSIVPLDDFVGLRAINRNLAIVIDSDKEDVSHIPRNNAAKQRIADEFNKYGGFCWITDGREIENYVPPQLMAEVLVKVLGKHSDGLHSFLRTLIDHPENEVSRNDLESAKYADYMTWRMGSKIDPMNKVKAAKSIARSGPRGYTRIHDLQERVDELVRFIYQANSMQ
jgi:predicted ATPase